MLSDEGFELRVSSSSNEEPEQIDYKSFIVNVRSFEFLAEFE